MREYLVNINGDIRVESAESSGEAVQKRLQNYPRTGPKPYVTVSSRGNAIEAPALIDAGYMEYRKGNWVRWNF